MANLLAIQPRTGETISPTFTITQAGLWQATVIGLSTAEYENPASTFSIAMEVFAASKGAWVLVCKGAWVGGPHVARDGTVNPPPHFVVDLTGYRQFDGRIRLNVPGTLTFGLDIVKV